MSKRPPKAQASSARAATSAFGATFGSSSTSAFGSSASQLAHVTEPPDLSTISDANVAVYFKNLSKKDTTTKARALEDLQAYMSRLDAPVEEGILEAWVRLPCICIYRSFSNSYFWTDQNVSPCLDRQRPIRPQQRPCLARSAGRRSRQEIRKTYAQVCGCLAVWSVR